MTVTSSVRTQRVPTLVAAEKDSLSTVTAELATVKHFENFVISTTSVAHYIHSYSVL